ncbi:MAG: glycosyltransferase family 4 protein [Bacteroidetes bacterium]|nr:glycosyltransferase family 4 protein [Bacteroidota bacterium]
MTSILFIETGTYGGGSFESLYLHLKYINRELYRPIVVLFNRTKYDNLFASLNVDVHHIDDPVYSIERSSFPIKVIRKLCSKAHRFNIRILKYVLRICHLNTIKIIKKIIKVKDISLIHMNDQILRDLFCVLISSDTKLPCVSHLRSMRSNGFTKQIADYANSKVTVYVANSETTKTHWKNLGIDEKKIEVIHNAIELKDVKEVRDNSKYSELRETKLGCIANFDDAKGHDFLLRSFFELTKKSDDYILFLAGKGSNEKKIRNLVEELNIKNKVFFLGYVEDSYSILSFIDILLVPSKNEAFGRVILEGMVSGTPVIATKIGGIPEVIQDGFNGILVEYGDTKAFIDAILNLTNNELLIESITKNARSLVQEKFSIERYIKEIDNVYLKVI